jgi:hypothetical protein
MLNFFDGVETCPCMQLCDVLAARICSKHNYVIKCNNQVGLIELIPHCAPHVTLLILDLDSLLVQLHAFIHVTELVRLPNIHVVVQPWVESADHLPCLARLLI